MTPELATTGPLAAPPEVARAAALVATAVGLQLAERRPALAGGPVVDYQL